MSDNFDLIHKNDQLLCAGLPILSGLPAGSSLAPLSSGSLLLTLHAAAPSARAVLSLGKLQGVRRFTALHRYEPFWMKACAGQRAGEVPVETQFLLCELENGACAVFIPLLDGPFRASLEGQGDDDLALVLESGDLALTGQTFHALMIAAGDDPFALLDRAARDVVDHLQTGRLRVEKPLPEFMDEFGWCTWDAFYQEVTPENVRQGLESFAAGGIIPRLLILDDGWQSMEKFPDGAGRRLTAFAAAPKFTGDLGPTVRMSKSEFGVQHFLVWHAFSGYWDGVDPASFPAYQVDECERIYSPGILHHRPQIGDWWGKRMGVVAPADMYRFYQDYHRHLRLQGVDGVKVDNQATIETVGAGFGGRVAIMQRYHEALEGSVHTHFRGNLINCMSCANEMLYSALNSNLTRTSTDFWPRRPETHGEHLYVNAQVSAWFSQFVHPDWDMFQSGHEVGAYHAAGRAVSGAPVYVSDKIDGHDFAVLRKLVLPDGSVLRGLQPGLPTRDCLFHDPTREDVLLKIFNLNPGSGVIGAFNARYEPETRPGWLLSGSVRASDVYGLAGNEFIIYAHYKARARRLGREDAWNVALPQLAAEVFTVVPLEGGVAPLGLVDLFNSGGAVLAKSWQSSEVYTLTVRGQGRFAVWCERAPLQVTCNGAQQDFTWSPEDHLAQFSLPGSGQVELKFS